MSGKQTKNFSFSFFAPAANLFGGKLRQNRQDGVYFLQSGAGLWHRSKVLNRRRYNKHRSHLPSFDKKKHGLAKP